MPTQDLRRLIFTVFFVVIVELLLLLWVPAGWLALASGFVGSVLLIIPPLRIEYIKSGRRHLKQIKPVSAGLQELQTELDKYFVNRIDEWYKWDSYLIFLGGIFLTFYFFVSGVGEKNGSRQRPGDFCAIF